MGSPGRFITLEGGDGAGKTSLRAALAAWLGQAGIEVVSTREPGGSPGAEEIRGLLVSGGHDRWGPVTEALLLTAARRDHVDRVIRPALGRGAWVVCDRFTDSTLAYQGYGSGVALDLLKRLQALALEGLRPDLTLVLDLPPSLGIARSLARGIDGAGRFEGKGEAFHQRLREGFLAIAAAEPERCVVIDATQPMDAVAMAAQRVIAERLGPGATPAIPAP